MANLADIRALQLELQRDLDLQAVDDATLLPEIPMSSSATLTGWNDRTCAAFCEGKTLNSAPRASIPNRVLTLKRFFSFYFTGNVHREDNLVAILGDTISLLTVSGNQYLFPDDLVSEVPFYPLNRSTPENLTIAGTGKQCEVVYPPEVVTPEDQAAYKQKLKEYTPDNHRDFLKLVQEALDPRHVDRLPQLSRLAGYLALVFWRGATKDKGQLGDGFLKANFAENLVHLVEWKAEDAYSPPCEEAIETACRALVKGLKTTSYFFALVVTYYASLLRDPVPDAQRIGLLAASFLTHTARNGLHLIAAIMNVGSILKISWQELRNNTYTSLTRASWNRVHEFFKSQMQIRNIQYTFHWSRVINDGYHKDFTAKNNLQLCAVLGGIIEKEEGPGYFKAEWARHKLEALQASRQLGHAVYAAYQPDITSHVAVGPTARHVAAARVLIEEADEEEGNLGALEQGF